MWPEGSEIFTNLAGIYSDDGGTIARLWREIEERYTGKTRFYHTLAHLEHVFTELTPVMASLRNAEAVTFAVFYHDLVYDVKRGDNEEESASIARDRLTELRVDLRTIESCTRHIGATRLHAHTGDADTDIFTDADLAILGSDWERYRAYGENVRKEYAVYPDAAFNSGRAGVLTSFLRRERIFKTDHFFTLYEQRARENMSHELSILTKIKKP